MTAPLVSIITPTFNRPELLPILCKCVLDQSVSDFEWLVLDDSPIPSAFMRGLSDHRIIYEHISEKRTIGAKRNHLVQNSRASIIAQFDDDDFYGQDYLSTMLSAMRERNADIVKLFGFFLYSARYKTFGYWDLTTKFGPHWLWSPAPPALVMMDEQNNAIFKETHLGFGFSYVFKKTVWDHSKFPDTDFNEDGVFIAAALRHSRHFKLVGLHDHQCTCIHVLHESNKSRCYPQYIMPNFLVRRLFTKAEELLTSSLAGAMPRV